MNSHVVIAPDIEAQAHSSGEDAFEGYSPPFDLSPVRPLTHACYWQAPPARWGRRGRRSRACLSVSGRALLRLWFNRVREAWIGSDRDWHLGPQEDPENFPYQELNVAVLLQGPRMFVPRIYATSEVILQIGRRYGMPKRRVLMDFWSDGEVRSRTFLEGSRTRVVARPLPGGGALGALRHWPLPWWSWPVHFPSDSCIEGLIEGTARARIAWVREGQLALGEPWLPHTVPRFPIGLYLEGERMRLPAP